MKIALLLAVFAAQSACITLPAPPSFASSALLQKPSQKFVEISSFLSLQQLLQSLQVDTHVHVLLFSDLHAITPAGQNRNEPFARELQKLLRTLSELAENNPLLHNLKQRYNFHVSTLPVAFSKILHGSGRQRFAEDVTAALEAVYEKHGDTNTLFLLSSPLLALFSDKGRACGVYGGIGASSYAWLSLQQPRIFQYGPSNGGEGFVDSLGSFITSSDTWEEVDPEKLGDRVEEYMANWFDIDAPRLSNPKSALPPFVNNAGLSNTLDTAALVFKSAQALFPQFHSVGVLDARPQKIVLLAVHLKLFDEGALHPGRRGGSLKSQQMDDDRPEMDDDFDDDADDFDDEVTRDKDANQDIALNPESLVSKLRTLFAHGAKQPGWPQVQVELSPSLSSQQQTQLEICVSLAVDGVADQTSQSNPEGAPGLNPGFRRIHSPIQMDCAAGVFETIAKESHTIQSFLQPSRQRSGLSAANSGRVQIVPLLIMEDRSETPLVLENFKLADVLAAPKSNELLHTSKFPVGGIIRRSPRVLAVYSHVNEELRSSMTCHRNDRDEYVRLPLDDRVFQIEILRASIAAITGHEPSNFFDSLTGMVKQDYLWAHPRTSPAVNSETLDSRELQYPARASIIQQINDVVTSVTESLKRFQRWEPHFGADFEESVLAMVQPEITTIIAALDDASFQHSHNEFSRAIGAVDKAKKASNVLADRLKELSSQVHETIYPADTLSSWSDSLPLWGVYAAYMIVGALVGAVATRLVRAQLAQTRASTKRRLGTFAR